MELAKVRATVNRMERLVKKYQTLIALRRTVNQDLKRTMAELDRLIVATQYRSRTRRGRKN